MVSGAAPCGKMWPVGAAGMANEKHACGLCFSIKERSLPFCESESATGNEPVRRESRTDCPECPGAAQRGPLYS